MQPENVILYWLIVCCEVAFWVLLVLALVVRYIFRRDLISKVILISLPILDTLLLAFTAIDLRQGSTATFAHGLATAYVGFTVAFGNVMVRWADQWFSHWFAGSPSPTTAARHGRTSVIYELRLWIRCVVAAAIIWVLLVCLIAWVDNTATTEPLYEWFRIAAGSVIFWFLFGPVWSIVFYRRSTQ